VSNLNWAFPPPVTGASSVLRAPLTIPNCPAFLSRAAR
jgi:hypothetical protein